MGVLLFLLLVEMLVPPLKKTSIVVRDMIQFNQITLLPVTTLQLLVEQCTVLLKLLLLLFLLSVLKTKLPVLVLEQKLFLKFLKPLLPVVVGSPMLHQLQVGKLALLALILRVVLFFHQQQNSTHPEELTLILPLWLITL